MSTINLTAHGLVGGERVVFSNIVPSGTGVDPDVVYTVLATGLTANTFQISETGEEDDPLTLTLDVTSASMAIVPETTESDSDDATYTAVTDVADVHAPPTTPTTPTAPTVEASEASGLVRMTVTLAAYADTAVRVRLTEVEATPKYTTVYNTPDDPSSGIASEGWDWNAAITLNFPTGSTVMSIPAIPTATYNVRARVQDTYGNYSAWSSEVSQEMPTGSDALNAAIAIISNDIQDGIITASKISDNAIESQHIKANAVTADALAATLLLASLIKTAESGRRLEFDVDGIRIYDASDGLLVRFPTDGTVNYFQGEVEASTLSVSTLTSLAGAVSLAGDAVMTLQTGISAPTDTPTLTASVEAQTLTGTAPGALSHGIAYNGGFFWIAADPATGYVAHKYNASTGAYVSSIAATGSTITYTDTEGSTSHVADTTDALATTANTHIAAVLTMPTGRGNLTITKVSVYCAGYGGACDLKNGVWNTSGTNLAKSAAYSAAQRTFSNGNDIQYNKAMETPAVVSAGATVWAGFWRTDSSDGVFWSKNDGTGKTTKSADGTGADGTGWATYDSNSKPNVYVTYTYDVDTRLETSPMVGIATDGTYVWTLDELGQVWTYDIATAAYVSKKDMSASIDGYLPNAGLFYDAVASRLVITSTTGATGTDYLSFVRCTLASGVPTEEATWTDNVLAVNGLASRIAGGCRVNDALNSSHPTYWVPVGGTVYAFDINGGASGALNVANRDFGTTATALNGLTHDGTYFRGWATATPTKVWKFSTFDWTTGGTTYWVGYGWSDGTSAYTQCGPTTSVTVKRHQRLQVQNGALPGGVADAVRIYMYRGASDAAAGSRFLQVEDALTARYLTSYATATPDPTTNGFSSGSPAEITSATGGLTLFGDGRAELGLVGGGGTAFPASPTTNDRFYRTDYQLEFFYDGTRWRSTSIFTLPIGMTHNSSWGATTSNVGWGAQPTHGGTDIWLIGFTASFFVASGGTALGASHKWDVALQKSADGASTFTTIATATLDSGASNAGRRVPVTIGALLGSNVGYRVNITKTGTPGNIFLSGTLEYRVVAT